MDVVHCHDYHPLPATLLASLVFRANFRIIYDAHEYESQKLGLGKTSKVALRVLEKLSSHFIDGFITVSDSIMKAYEKIFPRIPRTDIGVHLSGKRVRKIYTEKNLTSLNNLWLFYIKVVLCQEEQFRLCWKPSKV